MRRRVAAVGALLLALSIGGCSRQGAPAGVDASGQEGAPLRVALVAKSLGNGFFNAVDKGGEEAARELGRVQVIDSGPTSTTAEGQIDVLNALIAQHVDAIAVSANDPDALVPTLKKALNRGIKVISFDSAVASGGRLVHLAASSDALIGQTCVQLAAAAAPAGHAQIAILSATPTSTNQNAWIEAMKAALPQYPQLELVATVYGDDLADKSYREAVALLKRYPDLKVIIAPTSVGFAIWNPIDLGYAAVQLATRIARGTPAGPGATIAIGRLGEVHFDGNGIGPMGKPFVYDRSNVMDFAKVF